MIKLLFCLSVCFWSEFYFSQTDSLFANRQSDTNATYFISPAFSTTGSDVESGFDQQDVSSLLQSSRDVFAQFASFQFGAARYRMRGFSAENQLVMINGINVNNLETGYSSWSSWGGLNDVSRYVENQVGNTASRYGFSGAGGYTNIDSKSSVFKKGTRVSYANANKTFRNRFMLTHSTGNMRNGWALTFSLSNRYGNQVYIPGTYFNASSYYASIDKRFNRKHAISLTGFAAPMEQGRSTYEPAEAYTLAGTTYYNALWGYQNGKVRNSAVSKVKRPMFIPSHIYSPTKNSRITTALFYTVGKSSASALSWNNALNPHPDYYRYLPGYYYDKGDTPNGDLLTQKWATDINTRQVNWDRLIALNQANLYVLPSQLGQGIVTNETRARYIVEERVEDLKNLGINSVYNTRIGNLFFSLGINANRYKNRKYKQMNDLLGATYWLDYDQFAQNLGIDPVYMQNDIANPDHKIYKGDKFGYDYSININRIETWSQVEYSLKKVDLYGGITLSDTKTWRNGFVANGKFPLNSKGESEKINFFNCGIKGGMTYKITGRHFITANASFLTRPPETAALFVSPTVRNDLVNHVKSEKVISGDVNYLIKYPDLRVRFTYYNTRVNDQTRVMTYWNDQYNNTVNLIMKNINQSYQGIEFGIEKMILTSHVVQAAFGAGQFIYTNRPVLEAWQDNNNLPLFNDRKSYLKNYKAGGSPQLVTGIGYRYNAKRHWFAGICFNYFDKIYVEPNPDRRTEEALSKFVSNETINYNAITKQQRLPGYSLVNINGGFSYRINRKYILNMNLSVNNLLNNKTNITGGFEQLRWDPSNINKFANKYMYMTGRTYMLMINFNF